MDFLPASRRRTLSGRNVRGEVTIGGEELPTLTGSTLKKNPLVRSRIDWANWFCNFSSGGSSGGEQPQESM